MEYVTNAVMARRSVRCFQQRAVPAEKIEKLLLAGGKRALRQKFAAVVFCRAGRTADDFGLGGLYAPKPVY